VRRCAADDYCAGRAALSVALGASAGNTKHGAEFAPIGSLVSAVVAQPFLVVGRCGAAPLGGAGFSQFWADDQSVVMGHPPIMLALFEP
jgi:hypothetical protein